MNRLCFYFTVATYAVVFAGVCYCFYAYFWQIWTFMCWLATFSIVKVIINGIALYATGLVIAGVIFGTNHYLGLGDHDFKRHVSVYALIWRDKLLKEGFFDEDNVQKGRLTYAKDIEDVKTKTDDAFKVVLMHINFVFWLLIGGTIVYMIESSIMIKSLWFAVSVIAVLMVQDKWVMIPWCSLVKIKDGPAPGRRENRVRFNPPNPIQEGIINDLQNQQGVLQPQVLPVVVNGENVIDPALPNINLIIPAEVPQADPNIEDMRRRIRMRGQRIRNPNLNLPIPPEQREAEEELRRIRNEERRRENLLSTNPIDRRYNHSNQIENTALILMSIPVGILCLGLSCITSKLIHYIFT